jgi:hypothetical protein
MKREAPSLEEPGAAGKTQNTAKDKNRNRAKQDLASFPSRGGEGDRRVCTGSCGARRALSEPFLAGAIVDQHWEPSLRALPHECAALPVRTHAQAAAPWSNGSKMFIFGRPRRKGSGVWGAASRRLAVQGRVCPFESAGDRWGSHSRPSALSRRVREAKSDETPPPSAQTVTFFLLEVFPTIAELLLRDAVTAAPARLPCSHATTAASQCQKFIAKHGAAAPASRSRHPCGSCIDAPSSAR